MPKFSIITPVHAWHRLKLIQLKRCERSLNTQSVRNFEWIVVDDGSPMKFKTQADKTITQPHHERIVALNKGLKKSRGEWIVFLDSDDEFFGHTMECLTQMIDKNPDHKMFNFASLHVNKNFDTRIRGAFKPEEKEVGHEVFSGGNIVNGTFVFSREIYNDLGGYPPTTIKDIDTTELNYGGVRDLKMTNPWDFSAAFQLEFPEQQEFFSVDKEAEPKKVIKEIGNPWGNDHYLFYKYTRKYKSKPYDIPLIIIHHEGKKEDGRHQID